MLKLKDGIELPECVRVRNALGEDVDGKIVALDRQLAKAGIDRAWWVPESDRQKELLKAENDRGWLWHKDVGTLKSAFGNLGFAWGVEIEGGLEGAVLYQVGGVSELRPDLPTLMVYRLATAPWNRSWLIGPPRYTGVGSGLLRLAVYHSHRYGLGGRVTLEAYPDERLTAWYTHFGFRFAGRAEGGITLFELEPEAAADHLISMQEKT